MNAVSDTDLFTTVLVANRGEIAVRVLRTLRDLGIRSIAVYSDADVDAAHVHAADHAVRIGPAPAAESYRNIPAILQAAQQTGAQAIHPGYGFLSENEEFVAACEQADITFIGPSAAAVAAMGDKIAAKERVAAAGVPVVPGRHEPDMTDDHIRDAIPAIGLPVMLKPSAGGGGKGMRIVRDLADLDEALGASRREALAAFGDDTLLVERLIERPRHIEVQILADNHGVTRHLGERECSLQRRHQKVIEEAPSPFVNAELRERLGQAAIETANSCDYRGAGTVEFIVDDSDPDHFYFLEMNTRLQVEHPITEMVTRWDLVEWQVRIAAGQKLPSGPPGVPLHGHAVEARIYAEDPSQGFLPSSGELLLVAESDLVRVDSGVRQGQPISTFYDPMISKVIAFSENRSDALTKLDLALSETAYLGVATNIAYLRRLLQLPAVRAGDLHTGIIAEHPELAEQDVPDEHDLAVGALLRGRELMPAKPGDPWALPDGWRITGRAPLALRVRSSDGSVTDVELRGLPTEAKVSVADGIEKPAAVTGPLDRLEVDLAGDVRTYATAREPHGDVLWLAHAGRALRLVELDRLQADVQLGGGAGADSVRSPMPGTVIAVSVEAGDRVAAGEPMVTVEAMKMEHTLVAPEDAQVLDVSVTVGRSVALDEVLVALEPVAAGD